MIEYPICPFCGDTPNFEAWNEVHKYGYCNTTLHPWKEVKQNDTDTHKEENRQQN